MCPERTPAIANGATLANIARGRLPVLISINVLLVAYSHCRQAPKQRAGQLSAGTQAAQNEKPGARPGVSQATRKPPSQNAFGAKSQPHSTGQERQSPKISGPTLDDRRHRQAIFWTSRSSSDCQIGATTQRIVLTLRAADGGSIDSWSRGLSKPRRGRTRS